MSRSLLVHARLPDTFMFHALVYACHIFNVLPVKGLEDTNGNVCTPYTLFMGKKPKINHFRVFGCPVVARKWSTPQHSSGKQTERGIRGIFLGFDPNHKGYIFYAPGSFQIYISGDVLFNESFGTAIVTSWKMHQDSLSLRPVQSTIPTVDTQLEHTGSLSNFPTIAKEGNIEEGNLEPTQVVENLVENLPQDDVDDNSVPDLLHPDDDLSASNSEAELDDDLEDEMEDEMDIPHDTKVDDDISPQPLPELRRSTRTRKPNSRYAYHTQHYDWMHHIPDNDLELCLACASEAILSLPIKGSDVHSWEPVPRTIREILRMPDGPVKREWLKAVRKELKALVDANTFVKDTLNPGETSTPVMEIFKV
jgi:hypothetical protein